MMQLSACAWRVRSKRRRHKALLVDLARAWICIAEHVEQMRHRTFSAAVRPEDYSGSRFRLRDPRRYVGLFSGRSQTLLFAIFAI
jgi:hypothetical protein